MMRETGPAVALRDVTLRDGLDTPGVALTRDQRAMIAWALATTGVRELEVVAPGRVRADIGIAASIRDIGTPVQLSGLVHAFAPTAEQDVFATVGVLDHIDLLMPLAATRTPAEIEAKCERLLEMITMARNVGADAGVGFPNATQADPQVVADLAAAAATAGATRVSLYDTNGSATPTTVRSLIAAVGRGVAVAIYYHGHNDLGLATANALAAVDAGADGLDVTVNGLGDRAGNASLEQVSLALTLAGRHTGVVLAELQGLSALVARESGVPVSPLAPVVGRFAVMHQSLINLPYPELLEAYDPAVVGVARTLEA